MTMSGIASGCPVVAVCGVSFSRGAVPILRDFSFTIQAGQHTLILGPSGSGKTTLFNLLTGLLTADSGEILIGGEPMAGSPAARDDLRRRRIGIIFQTLRLVEAVSVTANLRLAQRLAGRAADDAEIARLLAELGLSHRAHARPRALSQGEAQRAAVARALVTRPDLLIADEPTSALDDASTQRVARLLIESAAAHGSTLLVATHDNRLKSYIGNVIELTTEGAVA